MRIEKLFFLAIMGCGAVLPACGGSIEVGSTGSGGSGGASSTGASSTGTGTSSTGTGASGGTGGGSSSSSGGSVSTSSSSSGGSGGTGGSTGGSGGGVQAFCSSACEKTADAGCFPTAECTKYCGDKAGEWPDPLRAAFAKCAAEHPLCFETIEGCMLGELYPPDVPKIIRLKGKGFGAYDGLTLHAWHDPETKMPFGSQTVLAGGTFSFEWNVPVPVFDAGGPLLLVYIDVDGDGMCKAAKDLTASGSTVWNGDLLAPVFELDLEAPLSDPDFVCDFPP